MSRLKAIETEYSGYKFRSRLEARWAVFFDVLGVEYRYEDEGYDLSSDSEMSKPLGNDTWYLPDFWLPQLNAWLEVKPTEPTKRELDKCVALHCQGTHPVLIGVGEPGYGGLIVICHDATDSSGGLGIFHGCVWGMDHSRQLAIETVFRPERKTYMNEKWEIIPWLYGDDNLPAHPGLLLAVKSARQARFEQR